jgi:hypothetical protein
MIEKLSIPKVLSVCFFLFICYFFKAQNKTGLKETVMEFYYSGCDVSNKKKDSMSYCPDVQLVASWIKLNKVLESALSKGEQPYYLSDISKARQKLTIKIDETGHYLRVSYAETGDNAVKFMKQLLNEFLAAGISEMFDFYNKKMVLIDKQIDLVSTMLNQAQDDFKYYKESKNIINYEEDKKLVYRKLIAADSLSKILPKRIEGAFEIEKVIIEDKSPVYSSGIPLLYLGYKEEVLTSYFKTLEDLYAIREQKSDSVVKWSKEIKFKIVIYLKEYRNAVNGQQKIIESELMKYRSYYKSLDSYEFEIKKYKTAIENLEKTQKLLLEKKTLMSINKSGVVPLLSLVKTPE